MDPDNGTVIYNEGVIGVIRHDINDFTLHRSDIFT